MSAVAENIQTEMPSPILFTDSAAAKVADLIAEEGNPDLKLRVFVQGGGCSGFQYGFTFDELYDAIIVKPVLAIVKYFNNIVERRGIDGFVNGIGKAVNYSSRQIRLIQTGQVGTYVLLMVLGILILFIVQLFL